MSPLLFVKWNRLGERLTSLAKVNHQFTVIMPEPRLGFTDRPRLSVHIN